jgi:hypothetical protein
MTLQQHLFVTTLLKITILITPNTGDITYNGITYNGFYLQMTLLITQSKKRICIVTLIDVIIKVIMGYVFISIVVGSQLFDNIESSCQ